MFSLCIWLLYCCNTPQSFYPCTTCSKFILSSLFLIRIGIATQFHLSTSSKAGSSHHSSQGNYLLFITTTLFVLIWARNPPLKMNWKNATFWHLSPGLLHPLHQPPCSRQVILSTACLPSFPLKKERSGMWVTS